MKSYRQQCARPGRINEGECNEPWRSLLLRSSSGKSQPPNNPSLDTPVPSTDCGTINADVDGTNLRPLELVVRAAAKTTRQQIISSSGM